MANELIGFISKKFVAKLSLVTVLVALGVFSIVSSLTGSTTPTGASSVSGTISVASNTVFSVVIALIIIGVVSFGYVKMKNR
jgi:hypothetical protein